MTTYLSGHSRRTAFLASLPERDRERLYAAGSVVTVPVGRMLHESGRVIADVCFPIDCVASLTATMRDGAQAEVAIIGPEGVVGVTAAVGGTDTTWNDSAVQIGGEVLRIPL